LTQTIGFRLVEKTKNTSKSADEYKEEETPFLSHVGNIAWTASFGDNTLETRQVGALYEVPLSVDIGPLDFEIDVSKKVAVFKEAYADADRFFRESGKTFPPSHSDMNGRLRAVEKVLRGVLGKSAHLRMNIMLPRSPTTLTVSYSFNMDTEDDCDDRLSFELGTGACGKCWEALDFVVCDLADARINYANSWKMDKYTQRLVRTSLSSLLSAPIFHPRVFRATSPTKEDLKKAFLGVLNIDSDDDIVSGLQQLVDDVDDLKTCTDMIARFLLDHH
jgi:hypothetical protein